MIQIITVLEPSHSKVTVKRSEFCAYISPAESESAAYEFIDTVRKMHYKANHHPYAFIVGKDEISKKNSDDGEPSQTAGRPILGILEAAGITDAVLVCARYFGGTKLGAGGLARAYSRSASEAVKSAVLVSKQLCAVVRLSVKYSSWDRLRSYISKRNLKVISTDFNEQASAEAAVPLSELQTVLEELADLTNGDIHAQKISEEYIEKIIAGENVQ